MKSLCLAIVAIILSITSAIAEPVTPPGTWLRMMKLTIRADLGAMDWARISRVYIDGAIKTGANPVCGRVTASLAMDSARVTRLFFAIVSVDETTKLAKVVELQAAVTSADTKRIPLPARSLVFSDDSKPQITVATL